MLDRALIPTPLVHRQATADLPIRDPRTAAPLRSFGVVLAIVGWTARTVLRRVTGRWDPAEGGRSLRELFERLGFVWVKAGQLLSLRGDLLPKPFCDELARLQFRADGFPFDLAAETLEAELGDRWRDHFTEFEEHPFAAASISQVHRAVLKRSGTAVVVKVQRPDVPRAFARDRALLLRMVPLFSRMGAGKHVRWNEMVWELDQILAEEIDYRYEAANLRDMRKALKPHGVYVPKVFDEASGARVLVMEFVPGVLMSDMLAVERTDPARLVAWQRENGVDPRRVGTRLFLSFLRQLLEDNLFHGDLHPGNIMLLRDNKFALIDFGSVGSLDADFLRTYMRSLRAIAQHEYGKAADLTLLLCPDLPRLDLPDLRADLIRVFREWDDRTALTTLPHSERSINNIGLETSQVLFDRGVVMSMSFLKLSRTFGVLDASLGLLIPDVNLGALLRKYFRGARGRAGAKLRRPATWLDAARAVRDTMSEQAQIVGPVLRHGALMFRGGTSQVAYGAALIFRGLKHVSFLLVLFWAYGLIELYLEACYARMPFAEFVRAAPNELLVGRTLTADLFVGVLLAVVCWSFAKIEHKLSGGGRAVASPVRLS